MCVDNIGMHLARSYWYFFLDIPQHELFNLEYPFYGKNTLCQYVKLEELSKFLEYPSNMLEISSQLIWNIPVTYWKFPVGSKMNLLFFDMLEAFKNSEKNKLSLLNVTLPI